MTVKATTTDQSFCLPRPLFHGVIHRELCYIEDANVREMVEMRANNNYWKNQWTTPRDEGKKQQWPRNGTKIRVFSTTTTSLLMIDWCGPQLQRRLNFSCWFTFRQTLATILASLKCKVIQFQERKLEISTAAVFKVTEIAFSGWGRLEKTTFEITQKSLIEI